MLTDIEIAQKAKLLPIKEIAKSINIPEEALESYGNYKAKVSCDFIKELENNKI